MHPPPSSSVMIILPLPNYYNFCHNFFQEGMKCVGVWWLLVSACRSEEVISFSCHSAYYLLAKHHWQSALPAEWGFWLHPHPVPAKPPDRPCRVWPYPAAWRGTSAHSSVVLGHAALPGNLLQLQWRSNNIFLMKMMMHITYISQQNYSYPLDIFQFFIFLI